ncbi:MAG: hypothetical protein IJ191_06280 [Treponema sp.]|nr:hypothetical protein [Treponema sp.]
MKIITAPEAAALLQDNTTVAFGGFGSYNGPDELLQAVADRFAQEAHPKGLTAVCGVSPGDNSKTTQQGLNRIARTGLLDTVIAGHLANPPLIAELIGTNQIAGYAIPIGVMVHLWRAIAGHKPAVITPVGLETYADPRIEGCKANQKASEQNRDIVSVITLDGNEYLSYKTFPIHACMIRATYADEDGNISMEQEGTGDYAYEIAAATHNSGGTVIVQVKEIVKRGTLNPKSVRIHHPMVDYVVKNTDPALHMQSYAFHYRPEVSGQVQVPLTSLPPMPLTNRKIIARRSALELTSGCLINLGIGMPSGISSVANEEGLAHHMTLSVESGPQGGVPIEGMGFSGAVNPEIIYNMGDVFDMYDGGILDMTFLGAAEIDQYGNVNVSKFGTRCTGPGGFINISQNTKQIFFVGTFTAGGLEEKIEDGKLIIVHEGTSKKFINRVQQITFSGHYARTHNQQVTFITERAVFKLTDNGLLLTEIAPHIDVQKDILDHMEFIPAIADNLRFMDERIFRPEKMGLA